MNKLQMLKNLFLNDKDRLRLTSIVENRLISLFFANKLKNSKNIKFFSNLDYYKNKKLDKFITPRLNKIFLCEN